MVQLSVGELQHLSKVESSLEVATPLVLSVVYPVKLGGGQDANKLSLYHCLVADGRTITWAMLTMVTDRDLAVFRVLKINRCFVSKTFHQAFPVINIVALDAKILGPMSEILQDPVKTLEALNMVGPEPVMTHTVLSMVAPEPAKTLGETDLESIDASSEKESESIETSSLIDTETLYELALDPFKAAKKGTVKPVENAGIPFKTVEQIGSERIGSTYSVECFFLEGAVVGIYSDSIAYPACRGSNCSYKVAEDSTSGLWLCNKCKGLWSVPRYLFEFSFDVSDDTGII